jgi:hypothetical protein
MEAKFLQQFLLGEGLLEVAVGHPSNPLYYETLPTDLPTDRDVFFAPAIRKEKGRKRENVLGSRVLWIDVDNLEPPRPTLPPTMIVCSGHGWHMYWSLESPLTDLDELEALNKLLIADVPTSDKGCWNASRLLRVPGTLNTKDPPARVELRRHTPELVYQADDFRVIGKLDPKTRHKIVSGDARGYRSRSERDWDVVVDLLSAGAREALIYLLFQFQPIGDKHRDPKTPAQYLEHTITRAQSSIQKRGGDAEEGQEMVAEKEDGYYMRGSRGGRRVSTFIIKPKILLDGSSFQADDAVVGDVVASGYTWPDVVFPREAFTSVPKLDRSCPVAAWQWLGRDADVRQLLPHLLTQLQEAGLPKIAASPVLGLHNIGGTYYFLGDKEVASTDTLWQGREGPLTWLPTGREYAKLTLSPVVTPEDMEFVRTFVPKLNAPEVVWILIGWFAASMLKPWLELHGYRFPILNVVGTRGSGKTTLLQRAFMPLFGQSEPKSYDSGTTRFVTLSLLGSTNAVPLAFSEFRYENVEKFIRFVLLSYDTGHDPRGRADQTTEDYPLTAPFSVDGEDLIADPAAQERVVVAALHPDVVAEGSEAYHAYNEFRRHGIPNGVGGFYIRSVLQKIARGELERILGEADQAVRTAFPMRLPDRVGNNHTVTYLGARLWCDIFGAELPPATILQSSIASVYSLDTGRGRLGVDDLVETVVNACAQGTGRTPFAWSYDPTDKTLWFQLTPAHGWWLTVRRRQNRGALERDAIKSQLKEATYARGPMAVKGAWMYGVSLEEAQRVGLDVPQFLNLMEVTVKL